MHVLVNSAVRRRLVLYAARPRSTVLVSLGSPGSHVTVQVAVRHDRRRRLGDHFPSGHHGGHPATEPPTARRLQTDGRRAISEPDDPPPFYPAAPGAGLTALGGMRRSPPPATTAFCPGRTAFPVRRGRSRLLA